MPAATSILALGIGKERMPGPGEVRNSPSSYSPTVENMKVVAVESTCAYRSGNYIINVKMQRCAPCLLGDLP